MSTILGIETSCDETAAAVVDDGCRVRSSVVASQVPLHRKYGGVVPEIASRAHIERLDGVIRLALEQAGIEPASGWHGSAQQTVGWHGSAKQTRGDSATDEPAGGDTIDTIDAIAVTARPGLVGSLLIGVTAAKTLSLLWDKPLIAVNHILAHAYSPAIGLDVAPWPAVALIVSGGHTTLFAVGGFDDIEPLGATTDDAAGEAFDKVATVLGLPYPGGPEIDRLARNGNVRAVDFPRTLLGPDSLDFSFSGIKTAVLYHVHGQGKTSGGLDRWSQQDLADIAASFQAAVIDVLVTKTLRAVKQTGYPTVVLGGGVAANSALRQTLADACQSNNLTFHAAEMKYCMDNAAMIAALAYHQHRRGEFASLDLEARAS
ncbi:MAG: tRNA (adenosine(37)-N6)-threonylcarbamoyltransferase complex transferase subunit TsaD [bacterium]|nr:tRNA (adenosine(37)-N6)-threonylcarbamoyltransferase complex transferase subunit TsaD [bacterium]